MREGREGKRKERKRGLGRWEEKAEGGREGGKDEEEGQRK